MAARGHFVFPIDAKNHRVLVIWDLNGYGEYEFVTKLWPVQALAYGGGDGGGTTKNIISPKFELCQIRTLQFHICTTNIFLVHILYEG